MRVVDKTQMSGAKEKSGGVLEVPCLFRLKKSFVALELLRGCGMILRAKLLRTSLTDGRCHGSLSSRVHPSSVIWCNGLNLSRGSRV
jgi:hypothetical protein